MTTVKKPSAKKAVAKAEPVVHGIKGFDSNLQCLGYQFEVGKVHEHTGPVRMCASGFHFIEGNPLDVLDFYPLIGEGGKLNRFASVTAHGEVKRDGSSKSVCATLTVCAELKIPDLIASAVKFVIDACKASTGENVQAASGHSSQLAASGDSSKLAASGDYSQLAASGDSSQLAASGYSSQLAASGDSSKLAASGSSKLAAGRVGRLLAAGRVGRLLAAGRVGLLLEAGRVGRLLELAASGDSSKLAASGDSSQLAASGDWPRRATPRWPRRATGLGQLAASGKNSVISASSPCCTATGADGTWISLAEFDKNGKCIGFATGCIGQDGLKPDTAYIAKCGKLVAA
jgi:hypothetical protein